MKKSLFVFGLAAIVAVMASCSGSDGSKIKPTDTKFLSGTVSKCLVVADQPAELSIVEDEDSTKYIRLKVTLQMVRSGLKNVDPNDIDFEDVYRGAEINLLDENETALFNLGVRDDNRLKLKNLLTGDEGSTADIIFECLYDEAEDAKDFEKVTQFTPYEAANIVIENEDGEEIEWDGSSDFSSDAAVSSDSGSEDWDALLDSYEEYVDSYVSMLQKASAGDMSAMTESASFLQKSQELTKKLSSATSGMSVSQVNRYNQINQKMLQAAQNMH
ncbi:hypothetical protein [Barnesiella sp. An55]|uniref:hypothetical protein n=1 Tax=Barnesiella sp. An55 TaxID=1965646 RepID=UPI000B3A27C6|nr:hypothetical protein [Barnesiella sp. An55]OUN71174.1 hypothetical protein B5G10_09475 [Barnesiella sp. An55]HIZ26164.1 hypothetical protein [Candidatus Barnesiella merdipullorum]